jgi:hypothetical protein
MSWREQCLRQRGSVEQNSASERRTLLQQSLARCGHPKAHRLLSRSIASEDNRTQSTQTHSRTHTLGTHTLTSTGHASSRRQSG